MDPVACNDGNTHRFGERSEIIRCAVCHWVPNDQEWAYSQLRRRVAPNAKNRKRSAATHVTRLLVRDGDCCYWCGEKFTDDREPTVEHLTPRSRGGSNELPNLALACADCNHEKGDLTEPEYRRYLTLRAAGIRRKDALKSISLRGAG